MTWGAIQGNGYASQFFAWIAATFPTQPGRGPHRLLNRGVGGATSSLFATCTRHFVPADADLVIVEFALNDGVAMACRGVRGRRAQGPGGPLEGKVVTGAEAHGVYCVFSVC